jgi:hypothetical protein
VVYVRWCASGPHYHGSRAAALETPPGASGVHGKGEADAGLSRDLNPAVQDFDTWLAANASRIPLG